MRDKMYKERIILNKAELLSYVGRRDQTNRYAFLIRIFRMNIY